jgi:serine protease Do
MARKHRLWPYTLLLLFLGSGCASILNSKQQQVLLQTEPSGATVTDEQNVQLGVTPFDATRLPKRVKVLTLAKEGYETKDIAVVRTTHNEYKFLDAMLLCIPCPFDFSKNAFDRIEPVNGTIALRQKLKQQERNIPIAVDKLAYTGEPKSVVGKLNGAVKRYSDKGISRLLSYDEDLNGEVISQLAAASLDPLSLGEVENSRRTVVRPRILLQAKVTDIGFDLHGRSLSDYKGTATISCDWNFYLIAERSNPVATLHTRTTVQRLKGTTEYLFPQLIREATRDLIGIDTLYDFLTKAEAAYLVTTKGSEIQLQRPPLPRYTSQKEMLKGSMNGVVTVIGKDGFGSGIIASGDGFIITNFHVIDGEKSITVKLHGDLKLKATVVKTNSDFDLALLKVDAEDLKALAFGNSERTEVGDDVFAIGTPLDASLNQTITKGIISGFREIEHVKFIQTDVSINSGNSGGPLVNEQGEVIGIATMKMSGSGVEGIGFGIPSNTAVEMLNIRFK